MPVPITVATGPKIQKATSRFRLRKKLLNGGKAKNIGQYRIHARRTPPVPQRLWRGGKMKRVHRAWDIPVAHMSRDISNGEKPYPPSFTLVNQKTGITVIFVSVAWLDNAIYVLAV
jgi:hypothetical protein